MNKFSDSSKNNMIGISPKLIRVTERALSLGYIDFGVIKDSFRTLEKQRQNVEQGLSQTMDSLHLPQDDGYSHAIDLFWYRDSIDVFKLTSYRIIMDGWALMAKSMFVAAAIESIPIMWGGFWKGQWDKPHFYLLKAK